MDEIIQTTTGQLTPCLQKKIDKTTYLVEVHFSDTTTQSVEDKLKRVILHHLEHGKKGKKAGNDEKCMTTTYIQEHAAEAGFPRLETATKSWLQKMLKFMDIKPFKIKYKQERSLAVVISVGHDPVRKLSGHSVYEQVGRRKLVHDTIRHGRFTIIVEQRNDSLNKAETKEALFGVLFFNASVLDTMNVLHFWLLL